MLVSSHHPWFRRLQHDLVKRLLWIARDCRDLGRTPNHGELVAKLIDDEGQPIDATELFEQLRREAPPTLELSAFAQALHHCLEAAKVNDLEGVLALEAAFEQLRSNVSATKTQLAPNLKGD